MKDLIERQAAIDAADRADYTGLAIEDVKKVTDEVVKELKQLPSEQPDGISLEWIDKHLEWLDNCDNDFAQLAKVGIRAMVDLWKKDRT